MLLITNERYQERLVMQEYINSVEITLDNKYPHKRIHMDITYEQVELMRDYLTSVLDGRKSND